MHNGRPDSKACKAYCAVTPSTRPAYAHGSEVFERFRAPDDASNVTHDTAINTFLNALRQVDHPRHVEAMVASHKKGGSKFLYPAVEFYLNNVSVPTGIDLQVLCTCDLDEDIKALAGKWNFKYVPVDIVSPNGNDGNYHPLIADANHAWLRSMFAKDYELHKHWCAKCG